MQQREIDISINSKHPIFFSHIIDNPLIPSAHHFHLHDYIEIYLYLSGDVDFIVEENYIPLKCGDIIVTTPNILHKPIIKSSARYERFYIGIPYEALSYINRGVNPLSFVNTEKVLVSASSNKFNNIISILNQISKLLENSNTYNLYHIFSYFLQFLNELNLAFQFNETDIEKRTNDVPVLITDILKYIDTSSKSISSVNELAEIFHINPSYLSDLFSKSTHVNLKQYLTTKKISEAKLLLSKNASISDVAYECGFSSCSHFITVFKKTTGKTPREYCKNLSQ